MEGWRTSRDGAGHLGTGMDGRPMRGKQSGISARLRVTQLLQSSYTGIDQAFDGTSTRFSYMVRFL